jgi:hypothetical protein
VGAVTKQKLAVAITDAKTNFFMQCSWVKQKSRSIIDATASRKFNRSLIRLFAGVPD